MQTLWSYDLDDIYWPSNKKGLIKWSKLSVHEIVILLQIKKLSCWNDAYAEIVNGNVSVSAIIISDYSLPVFERAVNPFSTNVSLMDRDHSKST